MNNWDMAERTVRESRQRGSHMYDTWIEILDFDFDFIKKYLLYFWLFLCNFRKINKKRSTYTIPIFQYKG
jgi:hypothetical protein